jgi:uncharacterized protein (TIGR02246 family)
MRKMTLILLPALILLVSGCQQEAAQTTETTATVAPQPAQTDTAASVRDIEAFRDQWVAAAEKDDAATVTAMYTADAMIDSPEEPSVEGREAIQAYWLKNFPLASGLQVRSKETEVSGDLGYDYGEFSQRITPPKGKAMDVQGRYLVVLKRQADGSWKIDKHFSFPLAPPQK